MSQATAIRTNPKKIKTLR